MSANSGRHAGPRWTWREEAFDGQEVSASHAAQPHIVGDKVLLRVRAHYTGGKRTIPAPAELFIARLLQHVLPTASSASATTACWHRLARPSVWQRRAGCWRCRYPCHPHASTLRPSCAASRPSRSSAAALQTRMLARHSRRAGRSRGAGVHRARLVPGIAVKRTGLSRAQTRRRRQIRHGQSVPHAVPMTHQRAPACSAIRRNRRAPRIGRHAASQASMSATTALPPQPAETYAAHSPAGAAVQFNKVYRPPTPSWPRSVCDADKRFSLRPHPPDHSHAQVAK